MYRQRFTTADGLQRAVIYSQQAINKDPTYGAAYSGLADCNSGAHASLGLVLTHRWDWAGAEAEFKRALRLNPRYANAHHWYGDYLSIMGRHDEALLEARQALELDPLNLMIGTWVGRRYYLARKYDLAIEQDRNTAELDANFAAAHLQLGENYVQVGLHEQGLAELQTAAGLSGNSPLYLAHVAVAYASAGRRIEALQTIAQLQTIASARYVSPYGLAQNYAALNDREQTFKWLQISYDDRAVWMSYLAVDPVLDNFRSDQRFQDLLRRVRLLP